MSAAYSSRKPLGSPLPQRSRAPRLEHEALIGTRLDLDWIDHPILRSRFEHVWAPVSPRTPLSEQGIHRECVSCRVLVSAQRLAMSRGALDWIGTDGSIAVLARLPPVRLATPSRPNCLSERVWLDFELTEIRDVVASDVKLSLTYIAPMLALRVVRVYFEFFRRQNPIADHIAPYRHPHKDVAAARLDLLEVHPKRLVGIGGESLHVQGSVLYQHRRLEKPSPQCGLGRRGGNRTGPDNPCRSSSSASSDREPAPSNGPAPKPRRSRAVS